MKKVQIIKLMLAVSFILSFLCNQSVHAAEITRDYENEFNEARSVTLDGPWLFFANQFLSVHEINDKLNEAKVVQVPSTYREIIKETEGYGTFAIKVNIPKRYIGTIQAIRIPFQHAAIHVYVDEFLVVKAGEVANEIDDYVKMQSGPISYFEVKQESFYVIVQFSSYGNLKSNFSGSLELGDPQELMKYKQKDLYFVCFLLGVLILVGLFSIYIGFVDKKQRILLILGLFLFVVLIRCVITAPFLYTEILLPFEISQMEAVRIEYTLSILIGYLFMTYLIYLYEKLFNKYVVKFNRYLYLITGILLFFIPLQHIQFIFSVFVVVQALLMSYLVKVLIAAYKQKIRFALMNVSSVLLLAISLTFELLSAYNVIPVGPYVLMVLSLISVILAYQFGRIYVKQIKQLHELNQKLFDINNSLDDLVQKRTEELTELNIKLKNQATIDGLTGIYNRTFLNEELDLLYTQAIEYEESLAVVMFDIDEFKQYNDNNGHLHGDEILITIVKLLKEQIPPQAIFARYGGEEFVVLLYNYRKEEVEELCEQIRRTIEAANIEHHTSVFKRVTISLGAAYMKHDDDIISSTELLELADRQLYKAKRTGKNKVSFY